MTPQSEAQPASEKWMEELPYRRKVALQLLQTIHNWVNADDKEEASETDIACFDRYLRRFVRAVILDEPELSAAPRALPIDWDEVQAAGERAMAWDSRSGYGADSTVGKIIEAVRPLVEQSVRGETVNAEGLNPVHHAGSNPAAPTTLLEKNARLSAALAEAHKLRATIRAETVEECAKKAEATEVGYSALHGRQRIATAIRSLLHAEPK